VRPRDVRATRYDLKGDAEMGRRCPAYEDLGLCHRNWSQPREPCTWVVVACRAMDIIEQIRVALERHLGCSVQAVSRQEWDAANHPGGDPALLQAPLTPFRAIELTGMFESAVASAKPWADEPGYHHIRRDPADAPNDINTDSLNVILDLPSHTSWSRVLEITGLTDGPELHALARQHVFLVPTRRPDHHSPRVPDDIASATRKNTEPGGDK
jgi:hypothetical protein